MHRKLVFASLLVLLPALHYAIGSIGGAEAAPAAQVQTGSGGTQPAFALCSNTLPQEPVLMYDVSGFGLGGQIHLHLGVYSNGLVSISSAPGGPTFEQSAGFGGFFEPKAQLVYVDPAVVSELAENLAAVGAFKACDEDAFVSDLPLTTVTVFRGETNSRAHTFSYWTPLTPQTQAVGTLISDFIATNVPNF
jgi:hypothetical protein